MYDMQVLLPEEVSDTLVPPYRCLSPSSRRSAKSSSENVARFAGLSFIHQDAEPTSVVVVVNTSRTLSVH